jgi:uncharacterized protein YwgA
MDRQQMGIKLTLDAIEEPLSLDSFNERMAIQKMVYLCQVAGVHLGYRYTWYLRGPYSPDLTRDAFSLQASLNSGFDETSGSKLDSESVRKLERIKPLWRAKPMADRPRWLELLASLLFLKRTYDGRGKDPADCEKS